MGGIKFNSLVGITDYDEGTNLSSYLLGHGWNAEHANSPEEVLADLAEGGYGLVILDEQMLSASQWSPAEYLEAIGPETAVLLLTEPGRSKPEGLIEESLIILQHPFSYETLRLALDRLVERTSLDEDEEGWEEAYTDGYGGDEEEEDFLCEEWP